LWVDEGSLEQDTKVVFDNVGDDWGTWVDLPGLFRFLFYGGRYRNVLAEGVQSKIWVCSNGFLSFDLSNSTSPNPSVIPSWLDPPNALIAALWTDLLIDNQAKIIVGRYQPSVVDYFVVIWKNALDKSSGQRLTFAVALQGYQDEEQPSVRQGNILVAYPDVSSIGSLFTYGIEDHEGRKGTGKRDYGSALASLNGKYICFYQNTTNHFIKHLTLKFEDQSWPEVRYRIDDATQLIRGTNVRAKKDPAPQPNTNRLFAKSVLGAVNWGVGIGGAAAVAYGLEASVTPFTAPVGFLLVVWGFYDWYTYAQYNSIEWLDLKDSFTNEGIQSAYMKVPAKSNTIVDASLDIIFYWILDPPNNLSRYHNLQITAIVEYEEYPSGKLSNVNSSVNIEIRPDNNNSFDTAYSVGPGTYGIDPMLWLSGGYDSEDYYRTYLRLNYNIDVSMSPPAWQNFDLYLYNPSRTEVRSSRNSGDAQESISYKADVEGYWFIKVQWNGGQGFYNMTIKITGGSSGGCPYVFVWDGTQYVLDNNVLPASELSNGTDVEDYYRLEQGLVPKDGKYSLLISEFENEHSYIDQVKLLAVDHESDVNIAVTPDGKILTYKNPAAPISAVDNYGNDRLSELRLMDGNLSDPATYFYGVADDYLVLNFGRVDSKHAKLILRDDMKTPECIYIQVADANSGWKTVAVANPRTYWSIEAFDLSPHITRGQDFLVRLYWTAPHRLDYVGLDTTKQADYKLNHANLISATHSTQGDVESQLLYNDNLYAELIPGQQIQLTFTLPNTTKQTRTLIFYSEGRYHTIT